MSTMMHRIWLRLAGVKCRECHLYSLHPDLHKLIEHELRQEKSEGLE